MSESHKLQFWQEPPEISKNSKSTIWVERDDFYCFSDHTNQVVPESPKKGSKKGKKIAKPYLIVGFDTEFKTPPAPLTKGEIKAGFAKSLILSYQFHAKHPDGREWQGICCPDGDERISLTEFMIFVLGVGARQFGITDLPTDVYLVGHFTRADIPAFSDFKDLTKYMSALRSTFVSTDMNVELDLPTEFDDIKLRVFIRDTMLLTPQSSKSLKKIGDLVGVAKVELAEDKSIYLNMIRNMDQVRKNNWELFKSYALTDAEICVRYIEQVIDIYKSVTGKSKIPITLTSIGIEQLKQTWIGMDLVANDVLGNERVIKRQFNKNLGYYQNNKIDVPLKNVFREIDFVTECYHGGRNEQYWFGPSFVDDWIDFDLSSAYPTAMAMIGMPDWLNLHDCFDIEKYTPITLGFAEIEFEFPENTRYPCLPIRTDGGLIFPLTGISCCAAPEIFVAKSLGAKIKILHGVIVPSDTSISPFGEFIKDCLKKRKDAGKNSLRGLFWKEISNSTYGKTAQGLRKKRVYDLRAQKMQVLPESDITNPFFAAFITSFTRAVLGEIMNKVPRNKVVFSCTTDGFLTNINETEAVKCSNGVLGKLFSDKRKELTGDSTVLEQKHAVRCLVGWRTRGQATLIPGLKRTSGEDDFGIVLAKGGIFTAPEFETDLLQNEEITRSFFERTSNTKIRVEAKTGVREMVELDADFVEKIFDKRLNMEFDWKCKPKAIKWSSKYEHLAFSTVPWQNVKQFTLLRSYWEEYIKNDPKCIKTIDDFYTYSNYVESRSFVNTDTARYMHKTDGDVKRLRQQLCSAYKHGEAGLKTKMMGFTDQSFADFLTDVGIPCSKADVENAKKIRFTPRSCPATDEVMFLLLNVQIHLLTLEPELFLFDGSDANPIRISSDDECPFLSKVE